MEDIRIALAQITCRVGQLAENLEKHRQYTRQAAKSGARLICFSEASLTGYPSGDDVPHELTQPLNGELGRALVALSAETQVTRRRRPRRAGPIKIDRRGLARVGLDSGGLAGKAERRVAVLHSVSPPRVVCRTAPAQPGRDRVAPLVCNQKGVRLQYGRPAAPSDAPPHPPDAFHAKTKMTRRTRSTAPTCDTSQVHAVRNVRIPMNDGFTLAADLHFPTAAVAEGNSSRFPAIIEYTPYHKRNNRAYGPRATRYPYFAANGYVFVNVDIRGCGDSEGWSESPSSPEEIHDNVEVIRWCAGQPWCDGQVGMIGISYTAGVCFDAARQAPDELKAVIICQMCSDWYQGMACPGGTPRLFGYENYAPLMAAYNFAPPDAELLGERWLDVWRQRLEHSRPWSLAYVENLLDGPFWESRLLRGHEDRVKAAVFLIGGWSDWYPDDMLRVYSRLNSPKRIVIGPWTHNYPENAWPLPRINDRYECLRWFDRHLKGIHTNPDHPVDAEPPVTLFVREYAPPAPLRREDPGSFHDMATWPAPHAAIESLFLSADGRMLRRQAAEGICPLVYQCDVGHAAGRYVIGHMLPGWGMPDDQRLDEPFSLVFTAAGLPGGNQGLLLGAPEARLFLSSTAEVAFVSAKLCDVAPDGTSVLITKGLLNLTHRDGDTVPKPLVPGQIYEVRVALLAHAYRLLPGHRLRFMLAAADFQNAWPTPVPHVLTLHCGPEHHSQLLLPLARQRALARGKHRFFPSEFPPDPPEDLNLPQYSVERDLIGGLTTVRCKTRSGVGMNESSYTISHQRPAVAAVESSYEDRLEFPNRQVLVVSKCAFQSDETMFHHQVEIQILVDDLEFWTRSWQKSVRRKGW